MWAGVLKRRCVYTDSGVVHPDDLYCEGFICPKGTFCGKTRANPNFGVTSFDNIFYAFLAIFQSVTLEGWSVIMVQL
jgi:hypothetical protein